MSEFGKKGLGARFALVEGAGVWRTKKVGRKRTWRGATVMRLFTIARSCYGCRIGYERYIKTYDGRPVVYLLTDPSHSRNLDGLRLILCLLS